MGRKKNLNGSHREYIFAVESAISYMLQPTSRIVDKKRRHLLYYIMIHHNSTVNTIRINSIHTIDIAIKNFSFGGFEGGTDMKLEYYSEKN